MARIPSDFDADWYRTTFPDVELSGLGPAEHYRRFGRLMGRSANGFLERRATHQAEPSPEAQPQHERGLEDQPAANVVPEQGPAIIDRPVGFDPEQLLPLPAPARPGREDDERISIEALAKGPFISSECGAQALQVLIAYSRMFGLPNLAEEQGGSVLSCGADQFKAGELRIENAWFVERSTLRVMLGGTVEPESDALPLVIRAYQASPASPNDLSSLGDGIQLPSARPVFHDFLLLHPLMPLLIELSDVAGQTRAITLVPFPSLLSGGMHWAELRALQTEANPMDDFWSLSDLLLQETVGTVGSPDRSISSVSVDWDPSQAAVALSAEVQEWLAAIFGLNLDRAASDPEQILKKAHLSRVGGNPGRELALPANFMPTLTALVTRKLPTQDADHRIGSYLVADAETHRPRWSVLLPPSGGASHNVPIILANSPDGQAENQTRAWGSPIAIALRHPEPPRSVLSPPGTFGSLSDPLTVVLKAQDPSSIGSLLQSIQDVSGGAPMEVLVRIEGPEEALRRELNVHCGEAGWSAIPRGADLRDVAKIAQNELLLSLSDRVQLHDPSVLAALSSLLQQDEAAGSASCVLLGERMIKKSLVLEPGTGGLFPSGISFASAPSLSFAEPDVLDALPHLTYPVVANTLLLTLFRRSALAALRRPSAAVPEAAADIRIGLDLIEAGYRNWCTTSFGATLSGPHERRDCIDPFGGNYLEPERWADVLKRVTLIRELH